MEERKIRHSFQTRTSGSLADLLKLQLIWKKSKQCFTDSNYKFRVLKLKLNKFVLKIPIAIQSGGKHFQIQGTYPIRLLRPYKAHSSPKNFLKLRPVTQRPQFFWSKNCKFVNQNPVFWNFWSKMTNLIFFTELRNQDRLFCSLLNTLENADILCT